MRWKDLRTWQSMIDAATRLHDGIYSSQSPMPVPKMVRCLNPETQCMKLAIAAEVPGGFICTKPNYIPALQGVTDCDRRVYDWKEGGAAQSASKESKAPTVSDAKTADILAWVRDCLTYLADNAGDPRVRAASHMLLHDAEWPFPDVPVSERVYEALGNSMLDRLHLDEPWKPCA